MTNVAKIFIDNKAYEVRKGQNLLHAGLSLKLDIPYFCWHPAMGSVGACRLCAVKQFKDEEDTQGKLVMSCMTPATDGTRVSINDPEARAFRAAILEWLMINHPHDCPVYDEGGECHLQDMTVMTGHTYREFRFKKRTYRNQYLGPFINHEMNRCIQCYRCVRFYNDYAGGDDLQALAAHDHVYFGRHQDGVLESEFSGNLVEVCPTGVFTDKTLKQHYTRKWDLQTAPSICVQCGVGCNTIPGERYGTLRRIRNRYNGEVNRYFLCDRGRYGYEFVNSDQRIRQPLRRRDGSSSQEPIHKEEALETLQSILANSQGVIGIGSPRASLEANYTLCRMVGPERFFTGLSAREQQLVPGILDILHRGPARSPSLSEIQQADAVLVLGEDVTNTAPMIALALRQSVRQQPMQTARDLDIFDWQDAAVREAIQKETGPLYIATPGHTRLDDVATQTYRAAPDDIVRLGFAIAHALSDQAPAVPDLPDELRSLAETVAGVLREAQRPLVMSGTGLGSEAIIRAAANVAWALCADEDRPAAKLCYTVSECNSLGVGMVGGADLAQAFAAIQDGADTVIILENDLYRRAGTAMVDAFLNNCAHVVVIDHLADATTAKAEIVLPATAFAEADGTLVNNEGRAQRFYQVFVPAGEIQESWRWVRDMMLRAGRTEAEGWQNLDDLSAALAESTPVFEPIPHIAPPAGYRAVGQKIPRQPHRYSGRTALQANIHLHEPKPPQDPDAPLAFSMEGFKGQPPSALINEFWTPGWNSVQAVNKFQSEVGGPLHGGDPGRRLIEPNGLNEIAYFRQIPETFEPRSGQWYVIPLYHIFGSEPLSLLTPGIAERAPQPYLALNPEDEHSPEAEGEIIDLTIQDVTYHLPVKFRPELPPGVVGVPSGLPDLPGLLLPQWGHIK